MSFNRLAIIPVDGAVHVDNINLTHLDLSNCDISNPEELSFEIGRLFSYLHYVLRLDGYDCELVLGHGSDNKNANKNKKAPEGAGAKTRK